MEVSSSITIQRQPNIVFPWIADPDKAMQWQTNVHEGKIIVQTENFVGTTFEETIEEGGRRTTMHGKITSYIQDQQISFYLESDFHRVVADYMVKGNENESTLTVNSKIRWKFPMNILSLFIGKKIKQGVLQETQEQFGALKKLCEGEE